MQFKEIEPASKAELIKIINEIENENHFNEDMLQYNLKSYIGGIAARVTKLEGISSSFPSGESKVVEIDHDSQKSFLIWLHANDNVHTKFQRITPYDEIIIKYAKEYGLDWRLVASQMFFESAYKQYSKSFAGAMGLMQITAQTSKDLGLNDPYHAEGNIASGIKYLKSKFDTFKRIDEDNRLHFALASYNAGLGHVLDAQKMAVANGLDPYKWKNVADMLLDLTFYEESTSDSDDYASAKHGYCRGYETVAYVDNIMSRYKAYKRLVYSE